MPKTSLKANPKLVRLVRERIEAGEVASIAARTGLQVATLNAFALGRSPTFKALFILSDWAIDAHPGYLLADEEGNSDG